jgi:hypothetical protein
MVIGMARFSFALKAVYCTEDMWVQFRHNISFQAAKKQWDWVNFNGMRSFVLLQTTSKRRELVAKTLGS